MVTDFGSWVGDGGSFYSLVSYFRVGRYDDLIVLSLGFVEIKLLAGVTLFF